MAETLKPKPKQKLTAESSVPSFIKKIYEILEGRKFPDIIDWSTDGTALIIKSPMDFCHKVLPLYFKHNNLTSFIRQLNMYNFRKRRTQEMDHIYCHELFQRGKRHFLKEIKRKNHDPIRFMQKTMDSLDNTMENQPENTSVTQENHLLKNLNKDALGRIGAIEKKCKSLTSQNQALWHKVCGQHEREELLKGLLMAVMKQTGVTMNQLPILMKAYPHLFLSSGKLDKDELFKEISLDLLNKSQEKPLMNSLDFLGTNIETPELKSLLQMAPKPAEYFNMKPLNETREQLQASLALFQSTQKLALFGREPELLFMPNHLPPQFRPDLLKQIGMSSIQKNSLDSGLLVKRPFNYEIDDQQSLDSNFTGNSTESCQNEDWTTKEEPSTSFYYKNGSKHAKGKHIKKEECETNLKIEIVDFS